MMTLWMMNIRSYRKMIKGAKVGDRFYFNAINGTVPMVEYTRQLIKQGKITPVLEELEKVIVPEAIDKFMSGDSIFPEMDYEIIAV